MSHQLPFGFIAGNTVAMATQSRLPAFLLTRPVAQSQRFADALRERFGPGLSITISPLIKPEFLAPDIPAGPFEAAIFTSETGVAGYARQPAAFSLTSKRAYCVGERTADAAKSAGLEPVSADGDANALIALIKSHSPKGPLIHLCGQDTRGDVAEHLSRSGIHTSVCVVYHQAEQPLSGAAIALLQGEYPVVVPLFSPRTAALFSAQASALLPIAPLVCAALSDAVAQPVQVLPNVRLCRAAKPTAAALIEALAGWFAASSMP
jgi:uroporphyrinogen-III synthase